MNMQSTWPPPNLRNFMVANEAYSDPAIAWVQSFFAQGLFVAAKGLRVNATSDSIKREAARSTVQLCKRNAEAGWASKGFAVAWSDADYENIAIEMLETLPRHPSVVAIVERHLETCRDKVFNDVSLTHNDKLFVVYSFNNNETIFNEHSIQLNETPIETINRSLDFIELLIKSGSGRNYIQLKRILTLLAKVHAIVVDP